MGLRSWMLAGGQKSRSKKLDNATRARDRLNRQNAGSDSRSWLYGELYGKPGYRSATASKVGTPRNVATRYGGARPTNAHSDIDRVVRAFGKNKNTAQIAGAAGARGQSISKVVSDVRRRQAGRRVAGGVRRTPSRRGGTRVM